VEDHFVAVDEIQVGEALDRDSEDLQEEVFHVAVVLDYDILPDEKDTEVGKEVAHGCFPGKVELTVEVDHNLFHLDD